MVVETRNAPTFSHDVQKQLWDIRREHARLSGFYFSEAMEQGFIEALSVEDATAAVVEAESKLVAFKKKVEAKKKKRKGKQPAQSPPESDPEISETSANEGEEKPSDDGDDEQEKDEVKSNPENNEPDEQKKKS